MERQDDPAITGDLLLWRRIPANDDHVKRDAAGRPVPSSMNFKDKNDELSVHLASITSTEAVLKGHEDFGLVAIKAGNLREILGDKAIICTDPEQREPDAEDGGVALAHRIVCFKFNKTQARELAKKAEWVVYPKGFEPSGNPA